MSQLQENIHSIITAFYPSSRGEGSCSPLSREELRQLMEQEFEDAMESPQDPTTVTKVLCFLADDSSCRVDFRELLSLVFRVAKACYQPRPPPPGAAPEPAAPGKAAGERLPPRRSRGRTSPEPQLPERALSKQDPEAAGQDPEIPKQDPETAEQEPEAAGQDPENYQTEQDPETSEQDPETSEQDPETAEQDPETPEQDPETAEQDPEAAEQDPENYQSQEAQTAEQDPETAEQDPEIPEQDPENHQSQEAEAAEQEQDPQQEDGTEAPGGDPEVDEVLDTAAPGQGRSEAEEAETPKQELKPCEVQEGPGEGSGHPEREAAEQDLSFASETQGRDPNNQSQVCKGPWQDPSLGEPQKLLPQQGGGPSPCWDAKAWGLCQEAALQQLPDSKELEQGQREAEAPPRPAQHQGDAQHQRQPAMEQQLLQPLCQWPPQQG
ncbi:cornulin-like [Dryobates pubescens]|uniref:cornulin-like n=1 Tax=Dryobates pubescens TaxID=118200 RepID=UPI0023B941F7|nr:cornulin-like [Dryobates pubescens]